MCTKPRPKALGLSTQMAYGHVFAAKAAHGLCKHSLCLGYAQTLYEPTYTTAYGLVLGV